MTQSLPFIHQIFYDEASRQALDPGFIPLDNSQCGRSDWFEFWAIREFLHRHPLDSSAWYGFLSPRFTEKTRLTSAEVTEFLDFQDEQSEVVIISYGWDQIAYFRNPFEQGEVWHPGILATAQEFLRTQDIQLDLQQMVSHSLNTVFSNFVIAKPGYWKKWLVLADALFDSVEGKTGQLAQQLNRDGNYIKPTENATLKVFIQERLHTILFIQHSIKPAIFDISDVQEIVPLIFNENYYTRSLLHTCDYLKRQYVATGDAALLDTYYQVRKLISVNLD